MTEEIKPVAGAARYYASGRSVMMQPVDEAGNLIDGEYSEIDHGIDHASALKKVARWQARENRAVLKAAKARVQS